MLTGYYRAFESGSSQRLRSRLYFRSRMHAKLLSSCPTLCDLMGCSPPGSSVHGILQARILEWVAMSSSRGSSWPRGGTHVSYVSLHWQAGSLLAAPPGKPPYFRSGLSKGDAFALSHKLHSQNTSIPPSKGMWTSATAKRLFYPKKFSKGSIWGYLSGNYHSNDETLGLMIAD